MEFSGYTIEELQPGVFAFDDTNGDSMYLIVGEGKALLIDTCMMKENILPMLHTLTDKPIELALTHAHIDHMYHSEEFGTVYLHDKDIAAWNRGLLKLPAYIGSLAFHLPVKKYNVKHFVPVNENTVLDIGGNSIGIISAPGHTPGSCVYVDNKHRILFMGDAVGNGGATAWMWLMESLNIGAYRANLQELLIKLKPYETYQFLGGHRPQTFPTADAPDGHPLNIEVVRDMFTLCCKMLDHTVEPTDKMKQSVLTIWQYAYGTAGMWVRKNKIK